MARHELDTELQSQIVELKSQLAEKRALLQNQTDEIQKAQLETGELRRALRLTEQELEEYRSKLRAHEQNVHGQRRAWECDLTEKELLLQGRNAEIERGKSDIASLRKRVRELESASKQALALLPTNVALEEKSSKVFGSRRWHTGGRKRRWKT
jgi:chromosome segregation ATPase